MHYHFNDNELIYLIREKEDSALEIMYKKYIPLIKRRIADFKIKKRNYDDFFQEGLMMLKIAIDRYEDSAGKTFNKYFDMILQRKFIQILKRESKYFYNVVFMEDLDQLCLCEDEKKICFDEIDISSFSKFEKAIYEYFFIENQNIKTISKNLGCNERKIYNALSRIKRKLKNELNYN